jgi:uncharacterized protein
MKLFEPRGSHGIVMRLQHYPGRAPIDAYGNGGFRFAGMSHRGSILCMPSGIYGWSVETPNEITADSIARLLDHEEEFEVLLVGTGRDLVPLSPVLKAAIHERGSRLDVMSTGAVIRTYNIMLGENRSVAAALLAVN